MSVSSSSQPVGPESTPLQPLLPLKNSEKDVKSNKEKEALPVVKASETAFSSLDQAHKKGEQDKKELGQRKFSKQISNELYQKVVKRDLKIINQELLAVSNQNKELLPLERWGNTQNFVTKLEGPKYYKKEEVLEVLKKTVFSKMVKFSDVLGAFSLGVQDLINSKKIFEEAGIKIDDLADQLDQYYEKNVESLKAGWNHETINHVIQELKKYSEEHDVDNIGHFGFVLHHLQKNNAQRDPKIHSELNKMIEKSAVIYEREEIVFQINQHIEKLNKEKEKVFFLQSQLKKKNSSVLGIVETSLRHTQKLADLDQQITESLKLLLKIKQEFGLQVGLEELKKVANLAESGINQKKLTPYISAAQLDSLCKKSAKISSISSIFLKNLASKCSPKLLGTTADYAFKTGDENVREKLILQSAHLLDLDRVLLSKADTKLSGVTAGGAQISEGIAGQWIEGNESFPKEVWDLYLNTKKNLARAKFLEDKEQIQKLQGEFKTQVELLNKFGTQKDIQMHVLLDLIYCSQDSHINQYKLGENHTLYNFDFARFLAPSEIVAAKDSEGTHFVAFFRSVFLDHPAAGEPLSEELKKIILSWDVQQIKNAHQELVGNPKEFHEVTEQIKSLNKDKESCKIPDPLNSQVFEAYTKNLYRLCEHYQVEPNKPDSAILCIKKIVEKQRNLRLKCMQSIHPGAFPRFIERIGLIKKYVETAKNPTIQEFRHLLYPQLKPFFIVLERLRINPGQTIGKAAAEGEGLTTLDFILTIAADKKLATKEEIDQMQKALKEIKESNLGFGQEQLFFVLT